MEGKSRLENTQNFDASDFVSYIRAVDMYRTFDSHLFQVQKSRSGSPSHPHAEHRGFLWEIGGYVAIYRPTVHIMINVFLQALYYRIDCCVRLLDRLLCML
jgi:hypothetical protein